MATCRRRVKERHEISRYKGASHVKLQNLQLCGNCNPAIDIGRAWQYNVIIDYLSVCTVCNITSRYCVYVHVVALSELFAAR